MTEDQKNYILTHRSWVKSTFLNEEELDINLKYNKNLAHNLNRKIEADKEHISLIKQYRYDGIKSFVQWLSENGIAKDEADAVIKGSI